MTSQPIPNQQILESATYYRTAYRVLETKGSNEVLLPAIHCAAIAMELFLKALSGEEVYTPTQVQGVAIVTAKGPKGGRDLPSLYEKAPQAYKDRLDKEAFGSERLRAFLGHVAPGDAPAGFLRDVLDGLDGRLFTPSRYPYEFGNGVSGLKRGVSGLSLGVIADIIEVFSVVVA